MSKLQLVLKRTLFYPAFLLFSAASSCWNGAACCRLALLWLWH